MIGMQGNFNPSMMNMNMNMNMNNMAPIHPQEDPGDQDMMTEILNISKIKEGFYIGDKISAISLDVIIQFKITHMINATGNQIMNQWESIGIAYLTLNWSETPKQILFDSKDEIANRIVEFIDGSLIGKGEGILAHSFKGQDRVCIVVLIYLMKKYKWSLNKSMQYLKSKKQDVDIPSFFFEQLQNFENRLKQRGELTRDIPWEFEDLPDPEEKLLRNTYLNGVKIEIKNNNLNPNRKNNLRRIMWADTNPYQKSPLELNDSTNDLFYQKDLRPITVHQSIRPKKGCIKGMNKNIVNIGMNKQNNLNIIHNNSFKSQSINPNNNEIMKNFSSIEDFKKALSLSDNNNIFAPAPVQIDNNWNNNMNIPNITALRGEKNERNIMNNNYINQNNNNNNNNIMNKNNIPYNKNINLIATGKFNNQNNMNKNINDNMGNNLGNNFNNNNNNNINNNMNRFNPQQQPMIPGKKNNQIDVSSSDNFLNKERNNINNIGRGSNMMDARINKSVNIKEPSYNINSLNSLNPNNINYYNMHNFKDEPINMSQGLPSNASIKMSVNNNNNNMMFTFGKQLNNVMNEQQPNNNKSNPSPFRNDNNNNQAYIQNNRNSQFRNGDNSNAGFMNNNKKNVSPFRNDNNNNGDFMNNNKKNKNNISPFRNDNNMGYMNNNKKNNISPFHNNNDNSAGFMNNNRNNNNISPFHNNNDNSAGFLNNRQNIGLNNNYIKNKNNNTATNFYKDNQFQNMINYTPIGKERGIGDNVSNNNTSNTSNNKNKNIFSQKNQQMSNYNPVSRFNGRPMNSGGNNFNKNMINQNRINNNIASNKPLNNFNPSLIKNKDNSQTGPSLLNKNKNSGPIKIKNNNYINNLSKKPNTPDLNHYYNTGTGFMDNNIHNRFKYNTNNNKKDIKNNTMSNGFGYPVANNYNRKIGIQRPSTAPKKEKNNGFGGENSKLNRNNHYANNFAKPIKFNQRPSSAGGKNKNGYGYSNNINKNGIGKNLNNPNMNKNKKNMGFGINKRLPSPQIYSNSNDLGFNNNQNKNKYNPAKHRMPSPVIKSNNFMKRPPLPNSGPRIRTNKNDKF